MDKTKNSLIEIKTLVAFLQEHFPCKDSKIVIERHAGGYSNETFFVFWGDRRWVLRRPPSGNLLPTAHDMLREFRVLTALKPFTIRTPNPIIACDDLSVMGVPFYLMERVDGLVIRETLPPVLDKSKERRRIGEELIDALIELHSVKWRDSPLQNVGQPHGYLCRQIKRWKKQCELTLPHTRPLPGLKGIGNWLRDKTPPESEPTIVHGDYKIDNVVFGGHPNTKLLAILDWEMATLGDPLTDLGWLLSFWGETGDQEESDDLIDSNAMTQKPGFLSRNQMAARYEDRTGRTMENFPFYRCLAVWKYAVILEGLYRLYIEGAAANPRAAEFEWKVPKLVKRAERIINEAD